MSLRANAAGKSSGKVAIASIGSPIRSRLSAMVPEVSSCGGQTEGPEGVSRRSGCGVGARHGTILH
eukprot:3098021-Pyramimonas_sp.AAC.1